MKPRAEIQKAYRERRKEERGLTDMRITIPKDLSEEKRQKIRNYAKRLIKEG